MQLVCKFPRGSECSRSRLVGDQIERFCHRKVASVSENVTNTVDFHRCLFTERLKPIERIHRPHFDNTAYKARTCDYSLGVGAISYFRWLRRRGFGVAVLVLHRAQNVEVASI